MRILQMLIKRKKVILYSATALLAVLACGLLTHRSVVSWRWNNAASASAGFPYQIGLTKVIITPCVTAGYACAGAGADPIATPLCNTKGSAVCTAYSVASGMPAGGMGTNALFLNTAILQAGLMSGGQLIAGGVSPVLMDSGVLASAGGCYGCTAKRESGNKILAWLEQLDKYIIAGFKGK